MSRLLLGGGTLIHYLNGIPTTGNQFARTREGYPKAKPVLAPLVMMENDLHVPEPIGTNRGHQRAPTLATLIARCAYAQIWVTTTLLFRLTFTGLIV